MKGLKYLLRGILGLYEDEEEIPIFIKEFDKNRQSIHKTLKNGKAKFTCLEEMWKENTFILFTIFMLEDIGRNKMDEDLLNGTLKNDEEYKSRILIGVNSENETYFFENQSTYQVEKNLNFNEMQNLLQGMNLEDSDF